ncbi:MAG TPA: TolC family protein [Longimicrobiales bacterium]|nr:TolC family protein [Longimicrobiales bacterium]
MKRLVVLWLLVFGFAAPAAAQTADSLTMSLDEALARAFSQSEEVRLAHNQVELADAEVRSVRAGALPQINANLGYTRTFESQFSGGDTFEIPDSLQFEPDSTASVEDRLRYLEENAGLAGLGSLGMLFGNLPFGQENAYTATIGGSQLLFSGGRTGAALQAARAFREAARFQLQEQQADIELSVRTAYFRALFSQELERIAAAAVEQAERFLEQERLRERSGAASELEVLRAEVALANLRPQLVSSRNAAELATLDLKRLVNVPAAQPLKLTTPLDVPDAEALVQIPDSVRDLSSRASVQAAERQVRMRELGVKIARGAFFPDISVSMNYGRLGYPIEPFNFSGLTWRTDWSATLGVRIPIFDGLRRNAQLDQAQVQLSNARLQLAQLREGVAIQYQQAIGERRRAQEAIAARQQTVTQAQRVYDLTVLRYERGLATQLEVTDARLGLLQARTNLAQALSDFYVAEATVTRALGGSALTTGTR